MSGAGQAGADGSRHPDLSVYPSVGVIKRPKNAKTR